MSALLSNPDGFIEQLRNFEGEIEDTLPKYIAFLEDLRQGFNTLANQEDYIEELSFELENVVDSDDMELAVYLDEVSIEIAMEDNEYELHDSLRLALKRSIYERALNEDIEEATT